MDILDEIENELEPVEIDFENQIKISVVDDMELDEYIEITSPIKKSKKVKKNIDDKNITIFKVENDLRWMPNILI